VFCVDQTEELLSEEGRQEAGRFLDLLAKAFATDQHLLAIMSIRSDAYPRLQAEPRIAGLAREPFDLPPIPEGSLRSVIEGPARLADPPLKLEPAFVDTVLEDATGHDALPLLAFTLNRLTREHGADRILTLQHYKTSGGVRGAVIAAVDEALSEGQRRGLIPKEQKALETLLRQAFVPHLARVNEVGQFTRRTANAEEILAPARALVDLLVEARLLTRDRGEQGEVIEVAHEALLREWPLLRQFLEADREFLAGKRQLAEDVAIWQVTPAAGKADALLSGLRLTRAQQWLMDRASHELTPTERGFIRESIRAVQTRQRWRTRLAATVILLLAGFSTIAAWQWIRATRTAAIAVQNAAEARAEKARADQSASEAQRNADEAHEQRDRAEREALRATRQAEVSDTRAQLIQSQFILRDAPREGLRHSLEAAQKLDQLGAADEALPLLSSILNTARELPPLKPYAYSLDHATVFARQRPPKTPAEQKKLLTVVGSNDLTGIIDDQGHAVGRPIESSLEHGSYTNDAVWLDDEHFILATGAWQKRSPDSKEFDLFNAALRLYHADGTLAQDYLVGHRAPVTSVAVLEREEKRVVLAGDAAGNLIVKPADGELRIIPTGINASIIKIAVHESAKFGVVLVFRRPDPQAAPPPAEELQPSNVEQQKRKIEALLELPVDLSYLGDKPGDEIRCAIVIDGQLYACDRNSIVIWNFAGSSLQNKPEWSFTAHRIAVTAIALLPSSPILATASPDGEIRLWLNNGTMLAELATTEQEEVSALGFLDEGRRLLSSSSRSLRVWDVGDLADQLRKWVVGPDDDRGFEQFKKENWVRFQEQKSRVYDTLTAGRLKELIESSGGDKRNFHAYGRLLIATSDTGLRIIDTETFTAREIRLPGRPRLDKDGDVDWDDRTDLAMGEGSTVCVLHGSSDAEAGKNGTNNPQPGDRKLYAVNAETGGIMAEWALPANLKKGRGVLLTAQRVSGQTICWAAAQQTIYVFSSSSIPVRSFGITGGLNRIAVTDDGRIAVAVNAGRSGVEVRLLDRNANVITVLPGSPDHFDDFELSPDGSRLRATASDLVYEQDLGLESRLQRAKSRLAAWSANDKRADFYARATTENGEKSKVILREALAQYPADATFFLLTREPGVL
jgi:hypothetical protein